MIMTKTNIRLVRDVTIRRQNDINLGPMPRDEMLEGIGLCNVSFYFVEVN